MKKHQHRPVRKARPAPPRSAPAPAPAAQGTAPASPAPSAVPADTVFQAAFAAHREGRPEAAEAGYRAVLAADARHPHALNNLAILLKSTGRHGEAETLYRRGIAAAPEDAHLHSNLGCLHADLHRNGEAAGALRRALALRPDYPDALFNLGNALRATGDRAGAMAAYARALALRPAMAEALANKGDLHKEQAELGTAIELSMAALKLRPDLAAPYNNLGEALKEQGRLDEAVAVFQKGLERHPKEAAMHSNLLFALNYMPNVPPDLAARVHRHWGERHADPLLPAAPRRIADPDPDRRLRVGYLSPDFCTHSCAYFSEPLIRAHDRNAVEVFCYHSSRRQDATTRRFQELADHWRALAGVGDDEAAALIARDGIDILVDLAGHTGDGRLLVLARRPAAIQGTWLGYPNSTGMRAVDFRLTDAIADPPGAHDRWYTERLVRLPRGFLAFQPVIAADALETPPSAAAGHVTFGSFNNTSKVTGEVVRVWAAILHRVPGSRLLLKSRQLGDRFTRDRLAAQFAAHGIGPDRLELLARIDPVANHLRAYDRIDVGLDPFPYNGTTTTCEALWMGVPVVTLAGTGHVARVGASLLTYCGLPELVAADEAGYVETAAALARDPQRLASLRRGMRARLAVSPLTDYAGFARQMEAAYRALWRDRLAEAAA